MFLKKFIIITPLPIISITWPQTSIFPVLRVTGNEKVTLENYREQPNQGQLDKFDPICFYWKSNPEAEVPSIVLTP